MYYSGAQEGEKQCSPGTCEHLCLPKGNDSFVCKCAIGFTPSDETAEVCVGADEFLLYSVGYELKGISINNNSVENVSYFVFYKELKILLYSFQLTIGYYFFKGTGSVTKNFLSNQYRLLLCSSNNYLG